MSGLGSGVVQYTGPIQIRHISAALSRWLLSAGITFAQISNRVNPGWPHFVIVTGGTNAAILIQRGDNRASRITDRQADTLDVLGRAGWRICIAENLEDAKSFVAGLRVSKNDSYSI